MYGAWEYHLRLTTRFILNSKPNWLFLRRKSQRKDEEAVGRKEVRTPPEKVAIVPQRLIEFPPKETKVPLCYSAGGRYINLQPVRHILIDPVPNQDRSNRFLNLD